MTVHYCPQLTFRARGHRRLDLSNPTPSALEHLEATCDPATFGVDNRDVLDESYRKAGKLDNQCFAFNLDVGRVGLLEAIRMGLFPGRDERKAIHAELYKLNVYGTSHLINQLQC